MKATKLYGFGPRKSKGGFTLIELLIVMVILAILAGVVVMAVGGVFSTSKERAYEVAKDEVKNAVAQYASDNSGSLPAVNASVAQITIGATDYDIIDLYECLIAQGGILGDIPDSCYEGSGDEDDNCDGDAAACPGGHYVWGMDSYGNVYSLCYGTGCTNTSLDGFQGVYP